MPTLSFKAAPDEVQRIRSAAKAKHLSLSEYLRRAALPAATVRATLQMKSDRKTGLSYAVMAPGAPKLQLTDIKRLLADFP
jgi:uncharacterized protein (DUF1778 family)